MTIQELLDEFRIEYREQGTHTHTTVGWVNICCPFCSDNNFKLGINLTWNYGNCWSCGNKSLAAVLVQLTDLPYSKIKELVKDLPHQIFKEEFEKRGKLELPTDLGKLSLRHRVYLENRGFNVEEIQRLWKVRGIGFSFESNLAWRIFIPIEYHGRTVSWTTRSIGKLARYWNASKSQEEISIRKLLYGEDYVRHTIIVLEGPLDVWTVGPGAVCTCGMVYSRDQLLRMTKYPNRIICFDSTPDAQARARRLVRELEPFPGRTRNVVLETGKDPNEADKKEILELRSFLT